MDLTTLSLDDFLCASNCTDSSDVINPFSGLEAEFSSRIGPQIRLLGMVYSIHEVAHSSGDTLLLCDGKVVGFYSGDTLAIADEHQKKGLSVPLILAATRDRPVPTKRMLTQDGKKALTYAWNVANGFVKNPWP